MVEYGSQVSCCWSGRLNINKGEETQIFHVAMDKNWIHQYELILAYYRHRCLHTEKFTGLCIYRGSYGHLYYSLEESLYVQPISVWTIS